MESIKQQQYVAIALTLIFFFGSSSVESKLQEEFKKCFEQRSNKRSSADTVNYLFGIHIPFLPHHQNPDSCKGQQRVQLKPLPASWDGKVTQF